MTIAAQGWELLQRVAALTPADAAFEPLALDVFRFQATHNPLYRRYLELIHVDPDAVDSLRKIPFLPIQFFKTYEIKTGVWEPETVFTSSGTTGQQPSRHFVRDTGYYLHNAVRGFEQWYSPVEELCFLALLPSYLERSGSSLVAMAAHFIERSRHPDSGFFLHNVDELIAVLRKYEAAGSSAPPTVLLGVSFALLDLAEAHQFNLPELIVMETGGMKGRRVEPTRQQLHEVLRKAFGTAAIHSEYGMTELLSQAYSKGEGIFYPAATMRVLTREITDPLSPQKPGKSGGVNVIDLANVDSCAFIATEDLGRYYEDGSFEILGRFDNSDVRGCNLMVEKR
ncbi:MAG: acyl transferase [Saprospirales bacterium]|nr:acyl transferase [Saprospirales bacterium]